MFSKVTSVEGDSPEIQQQIDDLSVALKPEVKELIPTDKETVNDKIARFIAKGGLIKKLQIYERSLPDEGELTDFEETPYV